MRAIRRLTVVAALMTLSGCAFIDRSSVSSGPGATQGNGPSGAPANPISGPSVSQSGRFVAFVSGASNLVPDDTNGVDDVFVHDHVTGVTELISIGAFGYHGLAPSWDPIISDDGRFVLFSITTGLFDNPPSHLSYDRIFVRDRQLGTTKRASGTTENSESILPSLASISGNGRYVAFVGADAQFPPNSSYPPFVHDLVTGTTKLMPIPGSLDSSFLFAGVRPSLSDDGSRVTYSYLVRPPDLPEPTVSVEIVTVVADTATATVIATLRTGAFYPDHPTSRLESAISGDGNTVVVLLAEGVYGTLYRYDLLHPGLVPILTDIPNPSNLRISDDGNVIGFRRGSDFVITDANGTEPRVVSADNLGHPVTSLNGNVDLSGDGRWVAFASPDAGLVADDTNGVSDVFVRSVGFDGSPPS